VTPDRDDIKERLVELSDLALRPGTYFNPQTEVVVVVDDSTSIDQEVFNMEEYEGADWVRISDEVPIDENARDEVLEDFQTHYRPGSLTETVFDDGASDDVDEDEEKPRPGHAAAESDDDEEEDAEADVEEAPPGA
jgi:hypothetical protein